MRPECGNYWVVPRLWSRSTVGCKEEEDDDDDRDVDDDEDIEDDDVDSDDDHEDPCGTGDPFQ